MSDPGQPHALSASAPRFPALVTAAVPAPAPRRGLGLGFFLVLPALGLAVATENPSVTIAAICSLALLIHLLWRPGLPPALLLAVGLQWLQGALMVLHANVRGVELRQMTYSRSIEDASYLTLAWVSCVGLGAWLVTRDLTQQRVASSADSAIDLKRLLIVYGAWTVGQQALARLGTSSMFQVIVALASMRWALVFAIFTAGWRIPQSRPIVIGILALEIVSGFLSFFADFKMPLYVLAVALATVGHRMRLRGWIGLGILFAFTLYLGVLWSAIKMDYRDRLSGGEGARTQAVVIGVEERFEAFTELVGTVDERVLDRGFDLLMKRVAYVEYFSYVIDYVPAVRDHERGAIWGAAITHVLFPRLVFPDKPPLEFDTVVSERYTGLNLGSGSGTSISLGIAAESYVDFGAAGVYGMGLLFGLMLGLAFRHFIVQKRWGVVAQGIAVSVCLPFNTVETVAAKAFGSFLSLLLMSLVTWHLVMPRLGPWLRGTGAGAGPR